MYTIYGIKNCGSMKKAFVALDEAGVSYEFFDYKKQTITEKKITEWVEQLGIETVLNKRGTTWRKQDDLVKQEADADVNKAISLMATNPSMIKRPILQGDKIIMAGFDTEKYAELG